MIYDSILGTIGKTPVVRINRLAPKHVTMYVKCEFFNPLSSVKDRLAIGIIEDAERQAAPSNPGRRWSKRPPATPASRSPWYAQPRVIPFVAIMTRDLLDRAPQDHAHARREGDPHPGRRARQRHGEEGRGAREAARLVPRAAVRERGEPRLPPQHDGPRDHAGLRRAGGSTTSSPAGEPAAPSPARER